MSLLPGLMTQNQTTDISLSDDVKYTSSKAKFYLLSDIN